MTATMRKKPVSILLLLVLAGIAHISAQEALSLSLYEAGQYALEYNKTLKNAALAVDAAREVVSESVAMGLPQVDANVDYSNFLGAEIEIKFGEENPVTRRPFKPTSNLGLTIGQLIFSGNYIVGLQTARIYKELSERSYDKTELDIKEQVTGSYYAVLVAEESYDIIERVVAAVRRVSLNEK